MVLKMKRPYGNNVLELRAVRRIGLHKVVRIAEEVSPVILSDRSRPVAAVISAARLRELEITARALEKIRERETESGEDAGASTS